MTNRVLPVSTEPMKTETKLPEHEVYIAGRRKLDNSLIWKCHDCKRVGLYLNLTVCNAKDYRKTGRRKSR